MTSFSGVLPGREIVEVDANATLLRIIIDTPNCSIHRLVVAGVATAAARSDETMKRENEIAGGAARQTTATMTARSRAAAIQNTTGNAGWLFTCSLRATAALSLWLHFAISMGSWRQRATFTAFRVGGRPTLYHLLQRLFSLPFAPISECVTAAHVFVDIVYKKISAKPEVPSSQWMHR